MIQAVLFDLDGTLADTARDLEPRSTACWPKKACRHNPIPPSAPIASHGARGRSLGFGIDREHPRFEEYRLRFLDHYEHSFADETVLFDGINSMLEGITAKGLTWGIITNKPMRFTDRLVPALPLPADRQLPSAAIRWAYPSRTRHPCCTLQARSALRRALPVCGRCRA
jgi:phosphoglycolate phosphatase